ncbi:MAG: ornithine carbamoyltransferase [Ignavibacteria bacterium GWB2_35_12]|nr:MAG: ornithine carbamoyltransferase [Ignavibacteria bacterium GWA2_35_8]OGU40247.1 MAG: ornithine carbamoyltransferase [Ignavibacteria bacterium GWB2_35_12]OGU93720.1 MAG: ornithine carbamoyltransferase [Ignavibacteria bacterium RIFOXYA2_FULL_35_10]OGV23200.1 MAG: ornithine carbamoyltransferase [Ignavibacteria bacterium RIFOXYC2_FULL_35_21]
MTLKRDFLSIRDFTSEEIRETFELALKMKANRLGYIDSLKGKTLALIFEKPSLRTRTSFDVGIQQLGGFSLYLSPNEINLGKRESVYDVAKNLERMVEGIMIRTFAHQIVVDMANHASIPIINGLTDFSHPCQAMADFLTILELKGGKEKNIKGLKLCYVGDGNNVAHSLMFAGARLGVNVTVACPKGFEPEKKAIDLSNEDAKSTGAKIEVVNDPYEGAKDADVVYTDVWASMGQEKEAEERKKIFKPYQVNDELMFHANKDAIFMHCLPAHRGDEVTDSVIDAPYSVVFQEAENRLHAQKAIMYKLMK